MGRPGTIPAATLLDALVARDFDLIAGVTCSFSRPLREEATSRAGGLRHLGVSNAGEAVAVASGGWLAGRKAVAVCHTTGFGSALTPLTSLNRPYRVPALLIVGWRGHPDADDATQHRVMGRLVEPLLDLLELPHAVMPDSPEQLAATLDEADRVMTTERCPFVLLVETSRLGAGRRLEPAPPPVVAGAWHDMRRQGPLPTRAELLDAMLDGIPDSAGVIAPTGRCGRELFAIEDRDQHFYMPGSIGCASGVALGVAAASPRRVIVLDGDGSAVMKLGCLATVGRERPTNLIHVLFDNGLDDGQDGGPGVAHGVDFPAVALACGYADAYACDGIEGFVSAMAKSLRRHGPALIHARVRSSAFDQSERPDLPADEIADRFREFISLHRVGA